MMRSSNKMIWACLRALIMRILDCVMISWTAGTKRTVLYGHRSTSQSSAHYAVSLRVLLSS